MNMPTASSPEFWLETLGPFLRILYRALDESCQDAQDLFDRNTEGTEEEIEHSHFASHVRWRMKNRLDSEDDLNGVIRRELNNNGLEFFKDNWRLRVLKARNRKIPGAGSNARRAFFQQPLFPGWEKEAKLVLLWEVDETGSLSEAYLAMPKNPSESWENSEAHWLVTLDHPAKSAREAFEDTPQEVVFEDELDVKKTGEER